jgi:hypothetical protein
MRLPDTANTDKLDARHERLAELVLGRSSSSSSKPQSQKFGAAGCSQAKATAENVSDDSQTRSLVDQPVRDGQWLTVGPVMTCWDECKPRSRTRID